MSQYFLKNFKVRNHGVTLFDSYRRRLQSTVASFRNFRPKIYRISLNSFWGTSFFVGPQMGKLFKRENLFFLIFESLVFDPHKLEFLYVQLRA